jgi:hypothetical protein
LPEQLELHSAGQLDEIDATVRLLQARVQQMLERDTDPSPFANPYAGADVRAELKGGRQAVGVIVDRLRQQVSPDTGFDVVPRPIDTMKPEASVAAWRGYLGVSGGGGGNRTRVGP